VALFLYYKVKRIKLEDNSIITIRDYLHSGAITFLVNEYKVIAIISVFIFLIVATLINIATALAYIIGVLIASVIALISLIVVSSINAKTMQAGHDEGLIKALETSFYGGSAIGLCTVGFSFVSIAIGYLIFKDVNILTGFGLGISCVVFLIRISGGIFAKSNDIAADLISKMGVGISDHDSRNPAVISDNLGDNIGSVVGSCLDLVDSFIITIIATLIVGSNLKEPSNAILHFQGYAGILFPILIIAASLFISLIGALIIRIQKQRKEPKNLQLAVYVVTVIMIIVSIIISKLVFNSYNAAIAVITGLLSGIVIRISTELYTSYKHKKVQSIIKQSESGAAFTMLSGLTTGFKSTIIPVITICISLYISNRFLGFYGITLSAIGLVAISAVTIAFDSYGTIADNASGIGKMAGLDKDENGITNALDNVGNEAKGIGKGYTIACAALSSIALFSAYITLAHIDAKDLSLINAPILIGLLLGSLIPFAIAAFTIDSVRKMTFKVIAEVVKVFKDNPDIITGNATPDYKANIQKGTAFALKEMAIPGLICIIAPVGCGLLFGKSGLAGMLAGLIVSGTLLSLYLTNAGMSWDNAKNLAKIKPEVIKSENQYNSIIVGDTIGDAFKDTASPAISTIIKTITIIAIIFASVEMFGTGLFN
ncbi:MAG: sodium-translocating pyrophosphatase, partial [Erysipelotrichales bacterium]